MGKKHRHFSEGKSCGGSRFVPTPVCNGAVRVDRLQVERQTGRFFERLYATTHESRPTRTASIGRMSYLVRNQKGTALHHCNRCMFRFFRGFIKAAPSADMGVNDKKHFREILGGGLGYLTGGQER